MSSGTDFLLSFVFFPPDALTWGQTALDLVVETALIGNVLCAFIWEALGWSGQNIASMG